MHDKYIRLTKVLFKYFLTTVKKNIVVSMTKLTLEMTNSKQDFVQIIESISREGVDFSHGQNNHIKN